MMNRFKTIGGLFIVAILALLMNKTDVYAKEREKFCNENKVLLKRYEIKIANNGNGNFTLTFEASKYKDIILTAKTIKEAGGVREIGGKFSYSQPYSFTVNGSTEEWVRINFETEGQDNKDPDCPGHNYIFVEFRTYCGDNDCKIDEGEIELSISYSEEDTISKPGIDCNNYQSKFEETSFDYKFCDVKAKAEALNHVHKLEYNDRVTEELSYQCASQFCTAGQTENCVPTDTSYLSDDEKYYVNKDYYYAKSKKTFDAPVYTYNYAPGDKEAFAGQACEIECEESLITEYGPPVATKAGLCFEYKVKVTSRVSCNMSKKPGHPEGGKAKYCIPFPVCNDINGGWYGEKQGGPNEEFKSCIKDCDGGKYTDKCSKECYNKVYGTSGTTKTSGFDSVSTEQLALINDVVMKDEIDKCIEDSPTYSVGGGGGPGIYKGCYYFEHNTNIIKFQGHAVNTVDDDHKEAPGRWYNIHEGYRDLSPYVTSWNGFYRRRHDNGTICTDICSWNGCSRGTYLNQFQAEIDLQNNNKIYEQYLKQCEAAASCTESTGVFTISADYSTVGSEEVKTIEFPYTTKEDRLASSPETCSDNSLSNDTTILKYDGCYRGICNPNIWYMTEWSFPGSWINNKTFEVSFEDKSSTPGWQSVKDKFCLPFNIKNVNQEWWNYYYKHTLVQKQDTSVESEAYTKDCGSGTEKSVTKIDTAPVQTSIDYNIHAKAKDFGYYKWMINIDCFYATNSDPLNPEDNDPTGTDENNSCVAEQNYRIRSVDPANLFPDQEGKDLDDPSETGRDQGFNWTDYAKPGGTTEITPQVVTYNAINSSGNRVAKSFSIIPSAYNIEPEKYIEKVQTLANNVYSNDYLDYYFLLTPKIMNDLKSEKKTFNNFDSGTTDINDTTKIIHYRSSKIRDDIVNRTKANIPDEKVLGCNNIKNYSSMECES